MNNLAFGGIDPGSGREYTYYETVAGGMGGGPGFSGLSGRQTHMTNTLNTPIEALENSFPVTVARYGFRAGSGGRGEHPGGMGLVRDFRFHAQTEVSILSERRRRRPYGLKRGQPGRRGRNILVSEGKERELPAKVNLLVKPGDIISIRTPGGGGYGGK
jgi:N-methylhydantoinase B